MRTLLAGHTAFSSLRDINGDTIPLISFGDYFELLNFVSLCCESKLFGAESVLLVHGKGGGFMNMLYQCSFISRQFEILNSL